MLSVDILYNANEYLIEVNKTDEHGYEKFLQDIKDTLKFEEDTKNLKVMTINSKNKFSFVTQDNFFDIINEKFEGNTLKVCASLIQEDQGHEVGGKIVMKHDDDFDSDNDDKEKEHYQDGAMDKNGINQQEQDDEDEFDFDSKKKENNTEGKIKEDIIDTNIKNEILKEPEIKENQIFQSREEEQNSIKASVQNNNILLNEKNINNNENTNDKEKKDIFKTSAIIVPEITPHPFSGLTEVKELPVLSSNVDFPFSQTSNNKGKSNLRISPEINFSDENPNNIVPPSRNISFFCEFSDESCDICGGKLQGVKYVCCICNSCTICDLCEADHPHPTIKYKTHFLSTLEETFLFIQKKQDVAKSSGKFIDNLMNKEVELSLELVVDQEITMRPNQTCKIPILIQNSSKVDISSNDFSLLVRNFKKIKISYDENFKFTVKARSSISINLIVTSKYALCKEEIDIEIYSNKLKIKKTPKRICKIVVEVNEDMDEDKLNKIFFGYDKITMLSKKKKEMILTIMNEQLSSKAPLEIYDILKNNNWDIDKSIEKLTESPETPES